MAVKVRGIYENGVVYLTESLPDETAVLAEMDRLNAELRALGDPADDTPEARARRVEIFDLFVALVPPLSDEEAEIILESIKRPMSMFAVEEPI